MSLSVVLSTLNEENNITQCLNQLVKVKEISEIIIIDDNSDDKTIKKIKKFKSKKIKLFVRKKTKGFASAFLYGLFLAKSDFIFRFDVDMYQDINYFIKSYTKHKKYQFVNFSRYIKKGSDYRSNYRKLPSKIINKFCSFFLTDKITDYTSCIFFIKKEILADVFPRNTKYANFIIEFIYDIFLKKIRFIEVPFIQKINTEQYSKSASNIYIFIKNGFYYVYSILRCLFKKII